MGGFLAPPGRETEIKKGERHAKRYKQRKKSLEVGRASRHQIRPKLSALHGPHSHATLYTDK